MTESTSRKAKSFRILPLLTLFTILAGAGVAIFATVAPATAASLTQRADAQIAIFVVPLAVLLFGIIFEVTRFAMRAELPTQPPRQTRIRAWQPGRGEG
jgi:hypothetical protein